VDRQAHWQQVYSTKEETGVSWFQEKPSSSLELLVGRVPPGGSVADVGGGASRLVDHLIRLGFRVTVLDIAPAALEKARARLGADAAHVDWVTADVTGWRPQEQFDLWHDRAVFHFLVEERDRRAYADAMATAVRSGGNAIMGTFALDGPEKCSGLPVRRYDAQRLAAEFTGAFEMVASSAEEHRTPAGNVQRFQFVVLRRL
jgi:2-polyprenyl-3-methyl-5-hydroxy-6-metoxy-1,4-benzoquinol methylase